MLKLSNRQQEVYDFIKKYLAEKGFCPALSDIARGLNLHDSTVATYVNILKDKGWVTSEYRIARSLRVVDPTKAPA
jgi:repressor LexA